MLHRHVKPSRATRNRKILSQVPPPSTTESTKPRQSRRLHACLTPALFQKMSNETEAAPVASAATAECYVSNSDEATQISKDPFRSLPSHVAKHLLSLGVCERCIFRLLGIELHGSAFSSVPASTLQRMLVADQGVSESSACKDLDICIVCLGILQFSYCTKKMMAVKKESANDLAAEIAEVVKREGHDIDCFSLEVSVPAAILENERAIRLHLKEKFGSEVCFQERPFSESFSAKDTLKGLLGNPLETLLGVKSGISSFRIRLMYSKTSDKVQNLAESNHGCKRRRTESENGSNTTNDQALAAGTKCSDIPTNEEKECNGRTSSDLLDLESSKQYELSIQKVNEPCSLVILPYAGPIYFGGRYLKYSRNVSQTRWIIDDERMGEASVEEIIGGNVLPMCRGDSYKFHAAGREDIDVRMLGSGRPFLVEIQNPRQIPSEEFVKEIEEKINNLEHKLVGVKNLRLVGSQGWTLMREGESEKQKQYAALVWISRPPEDKDLDTISSLKDMQILQRTPIRVLHRRSPLEREKIIHWMRIQKISGSSQYFLLHLCTQAGTYIKEFVHGDLGRTHPSIGSILGCRAEIIQLDVTDVKMDCFLSE